MLKIMPVISIKNPWGYFIFNKQKDVENRSRPLPDKYHNQIVLVHVSKTLDHPVLASYFDTMNKIGQTKTDKETLFQIGKLISSQTGKIIGAVRFSKTKVNKSSLWLEPNCYNWGITEVIKFDSEDYIEAKGQLGFWKIDLNKKYFEKYKQLEGF